MLSLFLRKKNLKSRGGDVGFTSAQKEFEIQGGDVGFISAQKEFEIKGKFCHYFCAKRI